jgi:hypothetical protein
LVGQLNIVGTDNSGNLYLDFYDQTNTSVVAGEYTVRRYAGNECTGIATIDLTGYRMLPNNVVEISETGALYQMKCTRDAVQIIRKEFTPAPAFVTRFAEISHQARSIDAQTRSAGARRNAPNSKAVTASRVAEIISLTWIYSSANDTNRSPATVHRPPYLPGVTLDAPSIQTGIPYCWGGFDSLTTSSARNSWANFLDAMNKGAFAGNVNTSGGYRRATAGLDCSGFVAATAGFTAKLNTTHLSSSSYTTAVNAANRDTYDLYVYRGFHVVYYAGAASNGVNTREVTTTGIAKTKDYSRSLIYLTGFSLRRFNGW